MVSSRAPIAHGHDPAQREVDPGAEDEIVSIVFRILQTWRSWEGFGEEREKLVNTALAFNALRFKTMGIGMYVM